MGLRSSYYGRRVELCMLYTHYVLSLSVCENIAPLQSCMVATHEVSELLQYSPKHTNKFKEIKV